MDADAPGACHVCGKPGNIHLAEIAGDKVIRRSYCLEHAPAEMRGKMPYGSHRTLAQEVAFLREKARLIDQQVADPKQRQEYAAEIERLIADIEAGRRRLGDAD